MPEKLQRGACRFENQLGSSESQAGTKWPFTLLHATKAFSECTRKYAGSVRRRCRSYLRDPDAAEDAAQEVFIRLLTHFESVPPEDEKAQAFIATCVNNLCKTKLLKAKTQQSKLERLAHEVVDLFDSDESKVEARQLVHRVLQEADTDCRVSVVKYHFEEVDQATIAREQNVTPRTVINQIQRLFQGARLFLEKCDLGEGWHDPSPRPLGFHLGP